jgi:CrcB protein
MSTFSYETFALLQDGENLLAIANTGVTFAACLGAVWLGSIIARVL